MGNSPSTGFQEAGSRISNSIEEEVVEGALDSASPGMSPRVSVVGTYSGFSPCVVAYLDGEALLGAAKQGDLEAVQDLLAAARMDTASERSHEALFEAAKRGHVEVVSALLAAGVSVGAADFHGRQALVMAAKKGHTEMVCALLSAGASLEAEDEDGLQALHWASMKGRAEVVAALLAAGASPHCEDARGLTPLHYAALGRRCGVFKFKGGSDEPEAAKPLGQGHLQVIQALVEAGAEVNKGSRHRETPLHCAAMRSEAAARLLLGVGADPHTADGDGQTPLHMAAESHELGVVRLLLEVGADPTAATHDGTTPLHSAMMPMGMACMFDTLLGAEADKEAVAKVREQFVGNALELELMLVAAGANPTTLDELAEGEVECEWEEGEGEEGEGREGEGEEDSSQEGGASLEAYMSKVCAKLGSKVVLEAVAAGFCQRGMLG